MAVCPKCNKILDEGDHFCDSCGAALTEATSEELPVEEPTVAEPSIQEEFAEEPSEIVPLKKKKSAGKAIVLILLGIVVLVGLILAYNIFFGGSSGQINYALYLKDNDMYFSSLKKSSEPVQLTTKLFNPDDFSETTSYNDSPINYYLGNYGYSLAQCTYMSEDGKYIFFPDKFDRTSPYVFNLYYQQLGKSDAEPIKIDSDVAYYHVNTSATVVTYLKVSDAQSFYSSGTLYQYNIRDNEKERIAKDVNAFMVTDDGKKMGYVNTDADVYLKYAGKDKEKIASDISHVEYINEDFTTMYYIKDNNLYKQVEGEEKEKIASDVCDVINIYDSGEIYYLAGEDKQTSLMDFVTDDMKDADASISEPAKPIYPISPTKPYYSSYSYKYDDEYRAEYDAAYEEYEKAYEEYEEECARLEEEYNAAHEAYVAKTSRDSLRTNLETAVLNQSTYTLCFYNGKEKSVIAEGFIEYSSSYAEETPVIAYAAYDPSSIKAVKLSKVENVNDVRTMVEEAIGSSTERYIAVKSSATVIEPEDVATGFDVNDSGTLVYYMDNVSTKTELGDLYCICISNGKLGKAELYDSDVYSGYFTENGEYLYLKNVEKKVTGEKTYHIGEMYINKTLISEDVYTSSVEQFAELGMILFFTDYDFEDWYGALHIYDGKKSVKIADDVYDYTIAPDGRVLYECDYNEKRKTSTIYAWSNGKSEKISDDVYSVAFTPDGEILYLYDYSLKKFEGDLYIWSKGKARLVDEEVVTILNPYFENRDLKYYGLNSYRYIGYLS